MRKTQFATYLTEKLLENALIVYGAKNFLAETPKAGPNMATTAANEASGTVNVLSKSEITRIANAANRINKPIIVVGSRASGTAGAYSDWDYIIQGLTNKEWKQIKNSLPGSKSAIDNMPANIDIFKGDLNANLPYIIVYPVK